MGSKSRTTPPTPTHSLQRPPPRPPQSPLNTRVSNSTALAVDTPPLFIPGFRGDSEERFRLDGRQSLVLEIKSVLTNTVKETWFPWWGRGTRGPTVPAEGFFYQV